MTTTPNGPAAPAAATTPTHGCVRCGAPVALDIAMCERCNPLGLQQPAASQAHGTVFLGIGLAVLLLAVLANLAVSGVGPFDARIASVVSDPPGINVTLTVTNQGRRAGATTCRVYDPRVGIGPDVAIVQTPRIEAGGSLTFNQRVTELGSSPGQLAVVCKAL
jgi:hypothetical protein